METLDMRLETEPKCPVCHECTNYGLGNKLFLSLRNRFTILDLRFTDEQRKNLCNPIIGVIIPKEKISYGL